ncbi:MAG: ArsB/NhaD family transporter [Candidatus Jordarchaeaceae archaeon]
MEYYAAASLGIFLVTLFLMIKRPRGINLGIAAGIGAIASLLLDTVSLSDVIEAFQDIWDAALAFIGIVATSVTLDAMGFFKWAALKVAKLAGGNGLKLYFYIALLTTAVSILFANDSAVLILTPIVLELVSELKMDKESRLSYLFAAGLIADTAAMPLITSNPVNIVSADYFKYSFIDHLVFMGPVAVSTIIINLTVIFFIFRKSIPKSYSVILVETLAVNGVIITPTRLKISLATLVAIDVGYVLTSFYRLPVSFVICAGAIFLLVVYSATLKNEYVLVEERKGVLSVIKAINWDILAFMIGIFLVVQGLKHTGVIDYLASLFFSSSYLPSFLSVLVPSLIVTVGASFMNNWPMTMLGLLSIRQTISTYGFFGFVLSPQKVTGLIFSNIIGNNLGPHFFPLGSLAILMWLAVMKRKGLTIGLRDYLKVGSILSILEVFAASIILWLEIAVFGLHLFIA